MRDTVSNCRRALSVITVVALVPVALVTIACEPQDPAERISELRGRYEAELNSWFIKREPPPPPPMEEESPEGAAAEGEAGAEAPPEPGAEPEAGAVRDEATAGEAESDEPVEGEIAAEDLGPKLRDVVLDIELWHDARERLPGITLDVTQADVSQNEKATYKIWVDTSSLLPGDHTQVNHVLEDIEVAEDDHFSVEVRHPVPPGERGEYPEFQQAEQSAGR